MSKAPLVDVLVVGAGLSGLVAARNLANAGFRVKVLDKGRGVGGRMATRRSGPPDGPQSIYDHGAQFFTVRTPQMQEFLQELQDNKLVREWFRGRERYQNSREDSFPRYCGVSGMTAIPKYLAKNLDVQLNQRIISVALENGIWKLITENNEEFTSKSVLLTAPVPQSLTLLSSGGYLLNSRDFEALSSLKYDPCIALMIDVERNDESSNGEAESEESRGSRFPKHGALLVEKYPIYWIADNYRKGISPVKGSITIHSTGTFAEENWSEDNKRIAQSLLKAAEGWIGTNYDVNRAVIHRWRFSKPANTFEQRFFGVNSNNSAPLAFAGDIFGGPKVEGAVLSGFAAAEWIIHQLKNSSL